MARKPVEVPVVEPEVVPEDQRAFGKQCRFYKQIAYAETQQNVCTYPGKVTRNQAWVLNPYCDDCEFGRVRDEQQVQSCRAIFGEGK